MTKVIVLGDNNQNKGPIIFSKMLDLNYDIDNYSKDPSEWDNIELICKGYGDCDLMFAFDDGKRNLGTLYLGYFNSGTVE